MKYLQLLKPEHLQGISSHTFLLFQGYSFIAPSILFNKNAVMGDFVEAQIGADRPGSASVRHSAMVKVRTLRHKCGQYLKSFEIRSLNAYHWFVLGKKEH